MLTCPQVEDGLAEDVAPGEAAKQTGDNVGPPHLKTGKNKSSWTGILLVGTLPRRQEHWHLIGGHLTDGENTGILLVGTLPRRQELRVSRRERVNHRGLPTPKAAHTKRRE